MNRTYLVQGEPALWLGSGYGQWKKTLAESINLDQDATGIILEFRVSSMLRNGHRFDLDNLVSPVFQGLLGKRGSSARSALTWWRASLAEYRPPALNVTTCGETAEPLVVPNGDLVLDCRIPAPYPTDSREGGCDFVATIRARLGTHAPANDDRFAIDIAFGRDVKDISWVEESPLKPVIDCLYPIFGGSGGAPDDWKTFLIQVRRDDPGLVRECAMRVWRIGGRASMTNSPRPTAVTLKAPVFESIPADKPGRSSVNNYERLDEAAQKLGSPPHELTLDDIIRRAKALYPEMESSSRDSLAATMDFQSINVRGRANKPGDFEQSDRWNRNPAFVKIGRGLYRRLSEEERMLFRRLFDGGDTLLRREAFDAADWDALLRKHGQ